MSCQSTTAITFSDCILPDGFICTTCICTVIPACKHTLWRFNSHPNLIQDSAKQLHSYCYLLQVQHHLLWVWADASPNAQLECLAKQPAVIDELQEEDKVIYMHPW